MLLIYPSVWHPIAWFVQSKVQSPKHIKLSLITSERKAKNIQPETKECFVFLLLWDNQSIITFYLPNQLINSFLQPYPGYKLYLSDRNPNRFSLLTSHPVLTHVLNLKHVFLQKRKKNRKRQTSVCILAKKKKSTNISTIRGHHTTFQCFKKNKEKASVDATLFSAAKFPLCCGLAQQ